jgi:hypothetical protein
MHILFVFFVFVFSFSQTPTRTFFSMTIPIITFLTDIASDFFFRNSAVKLYTSELENIYYICFFNALAQHAVSFFVFLSMKVLKLTLFAVAFKLTPRALDVYHASNRSTPRNELEFVMFFSAIQNEFLMTSFLNSCLPSHCITSARPLMRMSAKERSSPRSKSLAQSSATNIPELSPAFFSYRPGKL